MSDVQRLAASPGWRLIPRADHCSNTCALDSREYPQKPTTYLLYGVTDQLALRRCQQDCPFRLTDHPNHHKQLICQRRDKLRGQHVIRSVVDKGRIPLGIFQRIFRARQHDVCNLARIYEHRACLSFMAVVCPTCDHSVNVDDSASTFQCTSCKSVHPVVGRTTVSPGTPAPLPSSAADLWRHLRAQR